MIFVAEKWLTMEEGSGERGVKANAALSEKVLRRKRSNVTNSWHESVLQA